MGLSVLLDVVVMITVVALCILIFLAMKSTWDVVQPATSEERANLSNLESGPQSGYSALATDGEHANPTNLQSKPQSRYFQDAPTIDGEHADLAIGSQSEYIQDLPLRY